MLRSDANFSLKKGSFANACTNGAILMASGRVPNTVSTFTSILFEKAASSQALAAAVLLFRATAG